MASGEFDDPNCLYVYENKKFLHERRGTSWPQSFCCADDSENKTRISFSYQAIFFVASSKEFGKVGIILQVCLYCDVWHYHYINYFLFNNS